MSYLNNNLRQLKNNMLSEVQVREAAGEEENSKVYKVDLSNKAITRIHGLKPFSKLRCLQLNFNRIRCIENLEFVPDLRELHLQYNELNSISGLGANKLLTVLCLNANRIEKIQNVAHLTKLETFTIDENRISKITGLECLKDLKHLSLSRNQLASIDSLPAFSKLETLNAEYNQITKIPTALFSKCTKLAKLNLSNNQISELSFVGNLQALEWLNVEKNKLESINTGILRSLEYLNVSDNLIESLPKVKDNYPELSVFLFSGNQIMSEYVILEAVSQAEMLVEIDYTGNPMQTSDFQETLFKLYRFDRINEKTFSKPGSRYISFAEEIIKDLNTGQLGEVEDDQDARRIKMSGFYNERLEEELTGVKPERPHSGRKKIVMNLNYQEMEKSYHQVLENNKKIENLRMQCSNIFKQNGITINVPILEDNNEEEAEMERNESSRQTSVMFPTELKATEKTSPGNTTISELENRNQENKNKWAELKNKQKNFNIRGAVRRSGSSRKSQLREGSGSKLPSIASQKPDLMRTQLNPPRWNNDPNLMKTLQYRPLSAKKTSISK